MAITVTKSRLALILVIFFTVLVAAAAVGTAILLQNGGVGGKKNFAAVGQTPPPPGGYCNAYTGDFGVNIQHCSSGKQWCGGTIINGQCDGTGNNNHCTNQGFCAACDAGWTLDGTGACIASTGGSTDPDWAGHPGKTCATKAGGFPCAQSRFNNSKAPGPGQEQTCDARGTSSDANGWFYAVGDVENLDLVNESNANNCGATCSDKPAGYVGNAPACSNQYKCPGNSTGNGKKCYYCRGATTGAQSVCGADNPNAIVYPDANGNYPACPGGPVGQAGYTDVNSCNSNANGGNANDTNVCHSTITSTPPTSTPPTTTPVITTTPQPGSISHSVSVNAFCDSKPISVGYTATYNGILAHAGKTADSFTVSGKGHGSVTCSLYTDPVTGTSRPGTPLNGGTFSFEEGSDNNSASCYYSGCTPPPTVTTTPVPQKACTGLNIPSGNGKQMPTVFMNNSAVSVSVYGVVNPTTHFSNDPNFKGVLPSFTGGPSGYDVYYAIYDGDGAGFVGGPTTNTPTWSQASAYALSNIGTDQKFDPTILMPGAGQYYNPNVYAYAYAFVPHGDSPPALNLDFSQSSSNCYSYVLVQRPICQSIAFTKNNQNVNGGTVNPGDALVLGPVQWSASPIPRYVWDFRATINGVDSGWQELGQYNAPTISFNMPAGVSKAEYTLATFDDTSQRYLLYPTYNNGCYAMVNVSPPPTTTVISSTPPATTTATTAPVVTCLGFKAKDITTNGDLNNGASVAGNDQLQFEVDGQNNSGTSYDLFINGSSTVKATNSLTGANGVYTYTVDPKDLSNIKFVGYVTNSSGRLAADPKCSVSVNIIPQCKSITVTDSQRDISQSNVIQNGDQLTVGVNTLNAPQAGFSIQVNGGTSPVDQTGNVDANGKFTGSPYTFNLPAQSLVIHGYSLPSDSGSAGGSCSTTLVVKQPNPQLSIDKIAIAKNGTAITGSVAPDNRCVGLQPGCVSQNLANGDIVTYRLLVKSTGDSPVSNVVVSDNLTTNPVSNTPLVEFPNPNSANSSLRKCTAIDTTATSPTYGQCTAYDNAVTPLAVTTTFPKDNTSPTPHVQWAPIPTMNAGDIYEAELKIHVLVGGNYSITNSMFTTSSTPNVCTPKSSGSYQSSDNKCTDSIIHPLGVLSLSKTSYKSDGVTQSSAYAPGDTVEYGVIINNSASNVDATGLTLIDTPTTPFSTYFDPTTFVSDSTLNTGETVALSSDQTKVTWSGINVPAGQIRTLKFKIKLLANITGTQPACSAEIDNSANITVGGGSATSVLNSPTALYPIIVSANVCGASSTTLTKSVTPSSVSAGGIFTVTFKASNVGTADGTIKEITDYIPSGYTYNANLSAAVSDNTAVTVIESNSSNNAVFAINGGAGVVLHPNASLSIIFQLKAPTGVCGVVYNNSTITNPAGASSQPVAMTINCVVVPPSTPPGKLPNTGVLDNVLFTLVLGFGVVIGSYITYRFDLIYKVEAYIKNRKRVK